MTAAAAGEVIPVLGVARSLTGRLWRYRSTDERLVQTLTQRLGVPEIVARVLAGRDVDPAAAAHYLEPTLRDLLPDPSRFRDMDKAVDRVFRALEGGERIAVFGDYDVDGATSSALLVRFFRSIGRDLTVYIPDRQREGYGPNAAAMAELARSGNAVVLTVDCGVTAHEPLAAAQDAGLDVVVLDHHVAEPRLPPAAAVVNPNRLDEDGAYGELAAVGVTFMFVVALNRRLREAGWYRNSPEPVLLDWLDLVALGTVCDVVPLRGLNRALVRQGLKVLSRRANPGLVALADVAGLREAPEAFHLGFILGPRVNAGGRVGESDLGVRLLTIDQPAGALALAERLDRLNQERREIEQAVLDEAVAKVESESHAGCIVVAGKGWHPGVIGIVASRLRERFNLPACVIGVADGTGKGSGRSVPGIDLGAAVIAARQSGLLINGGGHPMAAGFTVAEDRIEALGVFLATRIAGEIGDRGITPTLGIDGALSTGGANSTLVRLLDSAGPYGAGNPEPRFVLANVRMTKSDPVGVDHVRCFVADDTGRSLKAIAFRAGDRGMADDLLGGVGRHWHVAGHLRPDTWQGRDDVQFIIDDLAPAS